MEKLGLNQIREMYLSFFEGKEHLRLQSSSLVPKNDKSLLLINAGMTPLKPYFTGMQEPPRKRVTTCQKCIRTGDIENVGKTSRHGTFFEMLGNFSFGDYFKMESIPWAWEFITEVLKLPKDRLYVTIYLEDDEAYDLWTSTTDIDPTRIFRLGKKDNFWEHGAGPCGPCSEIHFDRGEGKVATVEEFEKAADEDRVVEFWNLVFTQFDKDDQGNYNKLKNPNIDTGMGLERMATIMQGVNTIFEVDTISTILKEVCKMSGKAYGIEKNTDISIRIVTDHIRGITFMISDGILPSNEGRGYVLRRLLRRASRHGRLLGIEGTFLNKLCELVVVSSCGNYPELKENEEYIKKIIRLEEERFDETIDAGIQILNDYINELIKNGEVILSGEKAFKLYDTYGFPLELTEEILEEKSMKLDIIGFNEEMKAQKNRARAARSESNFMGSEDTILNKIPLNLTTEFLGYSKDEVNATVKLMAKDEEFVSILEEGNEGIIITDITPFYAEMGGQVGDIGFMFNPHFKAQVYDCRKNISGKVMHFVKIINGKVNLEEGITLSIDVKRRSNIRKNHTATHILNQALKDTLGTHINQSGSYVDDERLRFDFNHFQAVSDEELKKIERIINEKVMEVLPVNTMVMSIDEAKKSGAIALFDSKYKDEVRVVSIGSFSKELCGGTHASNSGEIGLFKIVGEYGVAAGIRRIEAVTGFKALALVEEKNNLIKEVEAVLKCSSKDIIHRINNLTLELKEKEKEMSELKGKLASNSLDDILNNKREIKGVNLYTGILKDIDGNSLRELADKIKDRAKDGVVVLGSVYEDKVQFVAMATKSAVEKGVHCGKIIKEVAQTAGGGGGGRPDMAQAGGKLPEKIKEAVEKSVEIMENSVK